jgi:hypothetical protein
MKVYPTFPVGSDQDNDLGTAKSWVKDKSAIKVDVVDNSPIKQIRLLSLEHRGQGGRAYKVLIDGKYYVDMREDVLIDVMLTQSVADGILGGEFIWAKHGTQMRLVRIGSELHKLLAKSNELKDKPKINKSDLEIGGIYRSRKGDHGIFLGYVNTTSFAKLSNQSSAFSFRKTPIKKAMLFYEPPRHLKPTDAFDNLDLKSYHYRFTIRKTHNFLEKTGDVVISVDYVDMLRKFAAKSIKEDILRFTGHKPPPNNWTKMDDSNLASRVCHYSEKLNLSKFGDPLLDPFDIKKFLVFS